MSTPKKTRLASSIDDDESFVISISKSLKKRFLEKDAATSLIESKKDAAIADIESEFLELKRQLLKRPSKTTTVTFWLRSSRLIKLFAPCGVILSCHMVVNFHFRSFMIIFKEQESVTAALNK
ncbi:hypothetical protein DAPPUDRAFT_333562 [Daphnia pulex]|uniref:Uncharacterized protein n=1 Tax=Daphnia pulex TaxID=6669 RepID=E9HT64_DAPPU|nr:hypothetical protein DAPPUDRAFT_333562 [Daphnia pulex]|eukprot:EFX65062.1 hypothetical protein DAPPUDRAFT_333562 [Daphnia pulex]